MTNTKAIQAAITEVDNIIQDIEQIKGCGVFNITESALNDIFNELDNKYMLDAYDFTDISYLRDMQHIAINYVKELKEFIINELELEIVKLTNLTPKHVKVYNDYGGVCIDVDNNKSGINSLSFSLFYDADDDHSMSDIMYNVESVYKAQIELINIRAMH